MGSSAFQPAMSAQGDAGASQPSAASGLQQPATAQNASNPEPAASQPSAGSAVQPAVAIHAADALRPSISSPAAAAMVRDVLEFGRIPIKRKQPSTDEQRQENVLAQRLIKHKKHMSEDDARQLDELPTTPKERPTAQDLMTRVRELGHYPSQRTALARQLQEAAALFQPAETAELDELRWTAQREQEARRLDTHSLMERVRALGHYPGQGTALARQVQEAAALFQPAETAELDELRLQEAQVKAAAEAEAQQLLEAAQAATMGDNMYATTEWLKAGSKDLLRVICAWEEADVRPDMAMKLMVAAITKKRRERAGASQPADCAVALKTAIDGVVMALQSVEEQGQGGGPHFNRHAVRALMKLMKLTMPHGTSDQKMRQDLEEAVQGLQAEADSEELDLTPYQGNCKCAVFLHWCIQQQQRVAEEAQTELEQPVDPSAACADGAQNLIDQDLLQLEAGIRTRPVLRRLQKYVAALQHDFMQQYKARTRNIDPYTIK